MRLAASIRDNNKERNAVLSSLASSSFLVLLLILEAITMLKRKFSAIDEEGERARMSGAQGKLIAHPDIEVEQDAY